MDAIRQALGYDKIFYYGESYGTQLGQFVLRRHPDILAGIVLDGIVPVTKEKSVLVSDIPAPSGRSSMPARPTPACNAAYPDIEAMLIETMDRLHENPASYTLALPGEEPINLKVDDLLAMNALFINLYVSGGYATLPELIKQLHEGSLAPMAATLPFVLRDSDNARVMHYAINCTDDPTTSLDGLGLETLPEAYARFVASDSQNYANICPALALPQLPADSDALVEVRPPGAPGAGWARPGYAAQRRPLPGRRAAQQHGSPGAQRQPRAVQQSVRGRHRAEVHEQTPRPSPT